MHRILLVVLVAVAIVACLALVSQQQRPSPPLVVTPRSVVE